MEEQNKLLDHLLAWIADYPTRDGPMGLGAHRAVFDAYEGEKRELTDRTRYVGSAATTP
jgi:hypothetical protein